MRDWCKSASVENLKKMSEKLRTAIDAYRNLDKTLADTNIRRFLASSMQFLF